MKILIVSVGSRGDMEPFLAVGELMKARGHEIVCLFPEQYGPLAEESGFRFISLGPEFIQMLESDTGKTALGGSASTWQKIRAYTKLAREYATINRKLMRLQYEAIEAEQPDRLLHHAKALYPLIWGLSRPGRAILLSPVPYVVHAVDTHSHVVFNRDMGRVLNRASYALANFGLLKTVLKAARQLGIQPPVAARQVRKALSENPAVYTISPSLFSRPASWPEHRQVLGYHERDKTVAWKPSPELLAFIKRHPKFLLITFGSMSNPEPEKKTNIFLSILQKHRIPAIMNTAGGGLEEPSAYDRKLVNFVKSIPYDWIFPKTYGVIHHGGSGTTHMALKYGCVSMIIPHIIDQYLWNTVGYIKGVGPKGPAITALKEASLDSKLLDLWQNPDYKAAAGQISRQMATEDFREELVEMVTGEAGRLGFNVQGSRFKGVN